MTAIDFRRMFYSLPTPYMVLDSDLRFIDMNDRYLEVTERTRADLLGRFVFDAFPESDERRAKFQCALERAAAGERNSLVREPFAIPVPAEQGGGVREIFWTCHHLPVFDTDGALCGVLQHAEDVTLEVAAEQMRETISQEFGHRIKNLLATILVIARRTATSAKSTGEFNSVFGDRVTALARTHQMLVEGGTDGTALADLVDSELLPFRQDGHEAAIVVGGPKVLLSSVQAQALGMALHELSTNAAKYGALSQPDGRLEVRWALEGPQLVINWSETGLSGIREPDRTGFGSRIVDEVMPMQLGGEVERRFQATGMRCTISVPLD